MEGGKAKRKNKREDKVMRAIGCMMMLAAVALQPILAQNPTLFSADSTGTPTSLSIDTSGNIHLLWSADTILYSVFDLSGQCLLTPVSFDQSFATGPHMVVDEERITCVWTKRGFAFNDHILARVLERSTGTLSPTVRLDDGWGDATRGSPWIVRTSDTTLLAVWAGLGSQTTNAWGVCGQFVTPTLGLVGQNLLLSDDSVETRDNLRPRIALDRQGGRFVLVWLRENDWGNTLIARWFALDGTPIGSGIVVPSDTGRKYYWGHSVATAPDGGWTVVWSAVNEDTLSGVFMRRFNASGGPLGPEELVSDEHVLQYAEAEIAADTSGDHVVVWETRDVWARLRAQRFDASGGRIGTAFFMPATSDTVHQYWPTVLLNGGKIFTAWSEGGSPMVGWMSFMDPVVAVAEPAGWKQSISELSVFPNPFNATALVRFTNPTAGRVSIRLYDMLGRMVRTIADGEFGSGPLVIPVQAADLSSGVYYIGLTSSQGVNVRKVLLLR